LSARRKEDLFMNLQEIAIEEDSKVEEMEMSLSKSPLINKKLRNQNKKLKEQLTQQQKMVDLYKQ